MKKILYVLFVLGLCTVVQAESSVSIDGGFIPPGECECPVEVGDASVDAGADAAVVDAGVCACPDAAVAQPDAAVGQPDAGRGNPDASSQNPDATVRADSSIEKPGEASGGGCAISNAPSASLGLVLVIGALFVSRRSAQM